MILCLSWWLTLVLVIFKDHYSGLVWYGVASLCQFYGIKSKPCYNCLGYRVKATNSAFWTKFLSTLNCCLFRRKPYMRAIICLGPGKLISDFGYMPDLFPIVLRFARLTSCWKMVLHLNCTNFESGEFYTSNWQFFLSIDYCFLLSLDLLAKVNLSLGIDPNRELL